MTKLIPKIKLTLKVVKIDTQKSNLESILAKLYIYSFTYYTVIAKPDAKTFTIHLRVKKSGRIGSWIEGSQSLANPVELETFLCLPTSRR